MKKKETIYKNLLQYINHTWDVKNINNLNPLVRLMIEGTINELLLLDNKLDDIDNAVSDKLVRRLLPKTFSYIRPSHAILQVYPSVPRYKLDKHTGFILKELPETVRYKNISSAAFTPVATTPVYAISIVNMFYDRTLWAVKEDGRKVLGHSNKRGRYNTIWMGLSIGTEIESLKNIALYLNFEHLLGHHYYYDIISEAEWCINDKPLCVKSGYPVSDPNETSPAEQEVLDFYKSHYLTITDKLIPEEITKKKIPDELVDMIDSNITAYLPLLHWVSVTFPANFFPEDLERLSVSLNAIPVVNRLHNKLRILKKNTENASSLSSGIGQEFLEIESVEGYFPENKKQSYRVEPVRRKNTEDLHIIDSLEQLADIIQDERSAFPGISNGRILEVLESLVPLRDQGGLRLGKNRIKEQAEVALFTPESKENTLAPEVCYWTTHADLLNGIPEGSVLTANRTPELNKADAVLLSETFGGRNFYNPESLKAINNFYLSSKDRILTKYNILSFCRIELGGYIEDVDVVRKAIVSPKLKEGIIIVMEIQICPKAKYREYFMQKGVLKDLLIRLRKKSPNNFDYRVVVKTKS